MEKIALQLQPQNKPLIDALKRGERVEITYHGRVLGVVSPREQAATEREERENAMAKFFGMREYLPASSVEDEARAIRRGRNRQHDDL